MSEHSEFVNFRILLRNELIELLMFETNERVFFIMFSASLYIDYPLNIFLQLVSLINNIPTKDIPAATRQTRKALL